MPKFALPHGDVILYNLIKLEPLLYAKYLSLCQSIPAHKTAYGGIHFQLNFSIEDTRTNYNELSE